MRSKLALSFLALSGCRRGPAGRCSQDLPLAAAPIQKELKSSMLICFSFVSSPREEPHSGTPPYQIVSTPASPRHRDKHPASRKSDVTRPCIRKRLHSQWLCAAHLSPPLGRR